ncbi:MAG: ATP-binding protein [Salinivirgaceae bacterium]|jgi:two-component system nitrogen regulation sensor histidine kinase NtrY|nr:ATP-binding protein [Salinivirgaceae bacterium]
MLLFRTKILHSLLVFIVLSSFAYSFSFFRMHDADSVIDAARVEKVILKKKQQTREILAKAGKLIEEHGLEWYITKEHENLKELYQEDGIAIVMYKNWHLKLWPENTVIVPEVFGTNVFEERLVKLGNSYFIPVLSRAPDIDMVGLIHIKSEYTSTSDLVSDQFHPDFFLSPEVQISTNPIQKPRVFDEDNRYLFSLAANNKPIYSRVYSWLIFTFFTGALLAFFRLFMLLFSYKKHDNNYYPYLVFSMVLIGILRLLMVKYQIPDFLQDFALFSPEYYASSWIAPSLGDLLLNTVFVLFFLIFIRERVVLNSLLITDKRKYIYLWLIIFIVMVTTYIALLSNLLGTIVRDSTIEFQPHKIFDITGFTLIAFLTFIANIITFLLFLDFGIRFFKQHLKLKAVLFYINIGVPILLVASLTINPDLSFFSALYYLLLINIVLYYRWFKASIKFSLILIFSAITAFYLTQVIDSQYLEKQFGRMQLLAVNLSVSQDFYAEMRLQQTSKELPADAYIDTLLTSQRIIVDEIQQYIQRNYFDNYMARYEMHVDVCHDSDSLFVEDSSIQWQHCREYYHELALQKGEPVYKSNYFYMGEEDAKLKYLGLHDILLSNGRHVTLLVHLHSKVVKFNPGFTQLLDRYKKVGASFLNQFDYAKYKNNRIVSKYGNFPYNLSANIYNISDNEFSRICHKDYCHLVYKQNNEGYIVVVSYPSISFFQLLINFSYLFVFVFILLSITYFYRVYAKKGVTLSNSIRNRIQFSMIGLLLISVIFIGGGSIYYIAQAYEEKNTQVIDEKIHAVITELQSQFSSNRSMHMLDEDYLNFLMQKYTNVYNSDISIFDKDGNLVSTSRPEIYKQDFLSRKMDFSAFMQMKYFQQYKIIQQERIGKLTYYSAYVQLVNKNNEILGFVNLPFFGNKNLLTEDISSIVVTFINVYLLLILLTIIIAIFISDNVTRPLQVLRQKMGQIDLKKHNTPIDLKSNDEVGYLVKEYNHMVQELGRSVELLARQERETAWRSMARQVAHEIKNPLTPMKLSVQLMLRAWKEQAPDFDQRLHKVSNTLIHQIDTLSNIATEFSTFARMPGEQIEKVEINELVQSAETLYTEYKNIEIRTSVDTGQAFFVLADKSRMLRVLNNLIKNAAQAIPKDQQGIVKIITQKAADMVLLKVSDNGEGIPEEIRGKLFQPNFTTKTKGMGLGLAMVKNIVEGFGGKIWYETESGEGTTFYIQLPLL